MASRASWNYNYEKGLLDLLVEHNVPIYRGQNGWVAEGWRSITNKFNEKFPLAKYTKQQIQEKEKDMKANYKAVRDARKQSGTGWNDSLCMIIAEPVIWDKLKKDFPRVRKFESKPFMLFPILASLYEGNVATGDLNFLSIPQVDLTTDTTSPRDSSANHNGTLNPFSTSHEVGDAGQSSSSIHVNVEAEPTTSATSGQKGEEPGKKRKQSQVALVLEEYMDFRKKQTQILVEEMKDPKEANKFTIANCVAALESMEANKDCRTQWGQDSFCSICFFVLGGIGRWVINVLLAWCIFASVRLSSDIGLLDLCLEYEQQGGQSREE